MKRRPSLSPRLALAVSMLPHGVRVADIGSDHGRVPVWLLQNNYASAVIATDIRPGPLERAKSFAALHGVQPDFRLCDGLSALSPEETDAILIAGMGGDTIAAILEAAPWAAYKPCVFSPVSADDKLRSFLYANNRKIVCERAVREHRRLYTVILAAYGTEENLLPCHDYASRDLLSNGGVDGRAYIGLQAARLEAAVHALEGSSKPHDSERLDYYRRVLPDLKQ